MFFTFTYWFTNNVISLYWTKMFWYIEAFPGSGSICSRPPEAGGTLNNGVRETLMRSLDFLHSFRVVLSVSCRISFWIIVHTTIKYPTAWKNEILTGSCAADINEVIKLKHFLGVCTTSSLLRSSKVLKIMPLYFVPTSRPFRCFLPEEAFSSLSLDATIFLRGMKRVLHHSGLWILSCPRLVWTFFLKGTCFFMCPSNDQYALQVYRNLHSKSKVVGLPPFDLLWICWGISAEMLDLRLAGSSTAVGHSL